MSSFPLNAERPRSIIAPHLVWLPKGKAMTIAIGFRFHKGIVVCADSQYTAGATKMTGRKVLRAEIGSDRLIFGVAGSVPYARMAVEQCVRNIAALPLEERTKTRMRCAVGAVIRRIHKQHIYIHPDVGRLGGPNFYLIVGMWSHLDGLDFFYTSETAMADITDYQCIGIGMDLAQFVTRSIFRHKQLAIDDAVRVATHVLKVTKDNVDGCGGSSQFAFLTEEGNLSRLHGVDIPAIEQFSEAFREAIERLYLFAADPETTSERMQDEIKMMQTILDVQRVRVRERQRETQHFQELIFKEVKEADFSPPDFKYD